VNVAVCVNQIPDPEAPPEAFRFEPGATQPDPWSQAFVMGPFDENALELALQVKDQVGGKVYALSVGQKTAVSALRKALAVTADQVLQINQDPSILDTAGVVSLLAATIRNLGDVDLVLCGRQSGEWDAGQLGFLLAEELGFSALALVRQVESSAAGSITVIREAESGSERVELALPAVISVTNDPANQLRVAKVRDIMQAERKPLTVLTSADLGLDPGLTTRVAIRGLQPPPGEKRQVEILDGQDAVDKAGQLADRIVELLKAG
jgi:electron transfer flavoprotein beta subunit